MRHRTIPITVTTLVLAFGLLACPAPARASFPSILPMPSLTVPPVVTLAMAQVEDDHDHGGEFASDADPQRNLAAPLMMIAAGLLYLGFVRWQVGRQRGQRPAR